MIGWKRYALAALLAFVLVCAIVATTPKPTEVSFGACSMSGVTITVRFSNSEITKCVSGKTGTGWQVLEAAGFKLTGTTLAPTGFVCKIDGQPEKSSCKDFPGVTDQRWVYYYATPGAENWFYSMTGAGLRTPDCGGAELWVLTAGKSTLPPTVPADKPRTITCR